MQPTTMDDRRKELQALLDMVSEHPELDWTEQRERARVLSQMIEAEDAAADA